MTDRPTRDHVLMEMAKLTATRSTCSRRQVGVVIAHEGRVLSTGYNGAPAGMEHCDHSCDCGGLGSRVGRVKSHSGLHYTDCASEQPCTISVHAEANAIAFAARHGVKLEWATLVTTCSPCLACAQLVINAGIKEVIFREPYRDNAGINLLENARLSLINYPVIA